MIVVSIKWSNEYKMGLIERSKDWLRIFRAQTASAVFLLVLLPYLVAGGKLFSWYGVVLSLWSILVHHISFGHNSVLDTMLGWDSKDPNKKHHPLIAKRIKVKTALKVITIGFFIAIIITIILVFYSIGNPFYALLFFSLFIGGGFVYNNGFSKISVWDFIPISVSFTSLSLFSYFLIANEFNEIIILISIYIALLIWFQIGVEGEIKEIEIENEINMLRKLGTKITGNIFSMGNAIIYPWLLKIAGLAVAGYIVYKHTFEWYTIILFVFWTFLALIFCFMLTRKREWNRKKSLRDMALEEVASLFLLAFILLPIIGLIETAIIIIVAIFYFVGMNTLLWKTRFAPRV